MKNQQETLYSCPFFNVIKDGKYFVITEKHEVNAAVIVAINKEGKILLARHYRPAIGSVSVEFPRGSRDSGESLEDTARRELLEETGFKAERSIRLGSIHSNTSLIRSRVEVFLLSDIESTGTEGDGEVESLFFATTEDISRMVANGDITDGHTLSAISLLYAMKENKEGA
ncbi:NUDIX hydrolase [Pseudomonas luteola]